MKCPNCNEDNDKVIETRLSESGEVIRRRRECLSCGYRFTSYERIEERPIMVIKKNGSKQTFSSDKIRHSIIHCTDKRYISDEAVDSLVSAVEREVRSKSGLKYEISSNEIGEIILRELYKTDPISYVRFASVYRSFSNVEQFIEEINRLRS